MSKSFQNMGVALSDTGAVKNEADSGNVFLMQPDSILIESDSLIEQSTEKQIITSSNGDSTRFVEEIKQTENNLPIQARRTVNSDWLTIIFLVAFVLLVTVRVGFQKYISSMFQSVVNYSTAFRMFREKNYSLLHGAFRLEVLFYIIFSVFVYQIIVLQDIISARPGFIFFAKTTGILIGYFFIKKFIYWIVGVTFKSTSETSEFLFNLDNFNRTTGIILFPVVTLIAYFPFGDPKIIMYLGIFAAAIMYVMLLQRGAIILLKKQFSIFYLFLYLCTLEFLPLLLIYKIVVE